MWFLKRLFNIEKQKMKLILEVKPTKMKISEVDELIIGFTAENISSKQIQPELRNTDLLVNGKKSFQWKSAVENGKREGKWYELYPDESVSISWKKMGSHLFTEKGNYELQLVNRNIKSEKINVLII